MHRFILGITDSKVYIDHKNHNGLDNRRKNIRIATPLQNAANKRKIKKGSSKYKGVHWSNKDRIWKSGIRYNGLQIPLGNYHSEDEAALAYNNTALKIFGEFALLNEVPKGTLITRDLKKEISFNRLSIVQKEIINIMREIDDVFTYDHVFAKYKIGNHIIQFRKGIDLINFGLIREKKNINGFIVFELTDLGKSVDTKMEPSRRKNRRINEAISEIKNILKQ